MQKNRDIHVFTFQYLMLTVIKETNVQFPRMLKNRASI